jgi:DNA-binding MarR family transcriptional regulator
MTRIQHARRPARPRGGAASTRDEGAQEALVSLLSAADRARTHLEQLIETYGVTGQQYNVLRILRGAGPHGLPTLVIAERLIERAPGITRLLDRLERQELVTRERQATDRRAVVCRLTARGLSLLSRMDQPVSSANQAVFEGLAQAEVAQLTALLSRVALAGEAQERGA